MPWDERTGIPAIDDMLNPFRNPVAMIQDQMQQSAQIPGPVGGPSVVGQQIPGGAIPSVQALAQAAPQPTAPLPPPPSVAPPVLPQADYSQVPQVKPLSTPRETYSNTRGGARANSIAQGIAGFREGAQRGEAVADRRAANKYRMAEARINSITNDATKTSEQKQAEIGKILNDPDVQRGARVAGVELPMEAADPNAPKPGLLKRIGGAVMQGVSGVQRQPAAGKVDVEALPQMGAKERVAQMDAQAALEQAPAVRAYNKAKLDAAIKMLPLEVQNKMAELKSENERLEFLDKIMKGEVKEVPSEVAEDMRRKALGLPPRSFQEKEYASWQPPPGYTKTPAEYERYKMDKRVSDRTDPQEEQDWEWFQKNTPIDPKTKQPYAKDRGGFRAWQSAQKVANQVTVINAQQRERPLTKAQVFQEERRLRDDLRNDLKDMDIPRLESAAKTIRVFGDRAIKEGSGAATDGIIVAFNKMIDSGSVVRESEFARTLQIGSLTDRLKGMVGRITVGQRLAPNVIKDLRDTALSLDAELQKYRRNAEEHYRNLAKDKGLNPDAIMRAPSMSAPAGSTGSGAKRMRFDAKGNLIEEKQEPQ